MDSILYILPQNSILSLDQLENLCSDLPQDQYRLELIYRARRFDYIEADKERFRDILNLILNKNCRYNYQKKSYLLEIISSAVNASRYAFAFNESRDTPLYLFWSNNNFFRGEYTFSKTAQEETIKYPEFEDAQKCLNIIEVVKQEAQQSTYLWATNLTPWNSLVEAIRQSWGDVWIIFHLANVASGIKSSTETYVEYSDLLDHSKDLCKRVRYARLRAGQYAWWIKQIDEASQCEMDIALTLLVATTWVSPKTLEKIVPKLDKLIQSLSDSTWKNLYNSVEEALELTQLLHQEIPLDMNQIDNSLNPRTVVLISLRAKSEVRKLLYSKYLKNYNGSDTSIIKFCYDLSLELLANDYSMWEEVRNVIQRTYEKGVVFEPYTFHRLSREINSQNIPDKIAEEIALNPRDYPSFLVAIAEMKMKEKVASKVVPVGETAIKNKWFEPL